MTEKKLNSLKAYEQSLKHKMQDAVPTKHVDHVAEYKAFLKNELRIVSSKLEEAKLAGVSK